MRKLIQKLKDPLYKNSIFLIAGSIILAGSGFFFWVITARLYPIEDVGLASAVISVGGLIGMLSNLGFDVTLPRYIPEKENKEDLINSCLTVSFLLSFLLALIFIAGVHIWSPSLIVIQKNKIFLLLFLIFTSVAPLATLQALGVFVGFREAKYSFIQTVIAFTRIAIIPFLVTFGALGIYASYGSTSILAFIVGIFLISKVYPSYKPIPKIRKEIIRDIFQYSLGNYFAKIFEALPSLVLPILVINILGKEANAYFYIAWTTSGLLAAIPKATSMSLLAEGSHDMKNLKANTIKAMKFIFILLGIAIAGIFIFGENLLWIFGEEYAKKSFEVLLVLALGSIPFALNTVYVTIKRIQKEIKTVIFVYGIIAIVTILGSYILMRRMGLIGVAFSWPISNCITLFIIASYSSLQKHSKSSIE